MDDGVKVVILTAVLVYWVVVVLIYRVVALGRSSLI